MCFFLSKATRLVGVSQWRGERGLKGSTQIIRPIFLKTFYLIKS